MDAARRSDSLVVFAACAVAYALLGQRTMYGIDAWNDLRQLAEGDSRSAIHVLYKPLAAAFGALGARFGLSLHDSVRLLSLLGSAVGVALAHAASRVLGFERRPAFVVAALVGAAPGVAFYATVVERHGPFFGFAGLACWVAARWARAPTPLWTAAFGVAIALGYAAHSTGVLLVSFLLPLAAVELRRHGRPWVGVCTRGFVYAAVGVWAVGRIGVWVGHTTRAGGNLEILLQYAGLALERPEHLLPCVWQEFILPLLPVSILWLARFRARSGERGFAIACLCGVAVHIAFTFLILGGFDLGAGFAERGAYFLPLAWPLAFATVTALGARVGLVAALIAVGYGVAQIRAHDQRPYVGTADAIRAESGDAEPVILAATRPDFELLFTEFPGLRHLDGYYDLFLAAHEKSLEGGLAVAAALPSILGQPVDRGRPVFLSTAAQEFLAMPPGVPHPAVGPAILDALRGAFRFVPARVEGHVLLERR